MEKSKVFALVKERFSIAADSEKVRFVKLETHHGMEPHHYPRFTMLC